MSWFLPTCAAWKPTKVTHPFLCHISVATWEVTWIGDTRGVVSPLVCTPPAAIHAERGRAHGRRATRPAAREAQHHTKSDSLRLAWLPQLYRCSSVGPFFLPSWDGFGIPQERHPNRFLVGLRHKSSWDIMPSQCHAVRLVARPKSGQLESAQTSVTHTHRAATRACKAGMNQHRPPNANVFPSGFAFPR